MSNTPRSSLCERVKPFFKPKILSTLRVDGLPERLPDSWPVRTDDDPQQSDVFEVDLMTLLDRWHELQELFFIDAKNVMCAIVLPKGDTRLVVHRRRWLKRERENFHTLFLFSECHFVLRSASFSLGKDANLDSILTWPVVAPSAETNRNTENQDPEAPSGSTPSEENSGNPDEVISRISLEREEYNQHCLNKRNAEILKYAERKEQSHAPREDSALASGAEVDLECGQYGSTEQSQHQPSDLQYFLCCQGLKKSEIVDMVLTVARNVGNSNGNVALTCPYEAKEFMEVLLGLYELVAEEDSTRFFGRRLADSVEVHKEEFFVRFGIRRDTLMSLAAVISRFREIYGTGVNYPGAEDLFDAPYFYDEELKDVRSFLWGLKSLEVDFINRAKRERLIDRKAVLNEELCRAGEAAGMGSESLKTELMRTPRKKPKPRAKPPMAVFIKKGPYKIIWHNKGRSVINKEHGIQFTGTGVKVCRTSICMWLTLFIGIVLVVGYFVYRGLSSNVSFEDLLQTALSIAALYAATIIPLVYYVFYNNEDLADVLSGRVHLDTRSEFDLLEDEEKLYLCLRSLFERQPDRRFIEKANTSYIPGTEAGGEMRVNINPCVGNLLMCGFKYWEREMAEGEESEMRRGLVTPSGEVLEFKESENPGFLHVFKPAEKVKNPTSPSDCPIEHYYVGVER